MNAPDPHRPAPRHVAHRVAGRVARRVGDRPTPPGTRRRVGAGDRGSITVWAAVTTVTMIVLVGLVVDIGGHVRAQQRAHDLAAQAARAGGQQIQAPDALLGDTPELDTARAVAAAQTYLTAAEGEGISGNAQVTGGDTLVVRTRASHTPVFLGIVGVRSLAVTGEARARLTRSVGGVEQ